MEREQTTRVFPAEDALGWAAALAALRAGEAVIFPTDTVYGVGADLWREEAIARLFLAKQRPAGLAIPVLVSAPEHVARVAQSLPPQFGTLAARFWPGGLTLVVPRRAEVPAVLCAGADTVAVRMPAHPVALRLIAAMGGALAVTSANLSGRPSPVTAQEALADLGGRVAVALDGGRCPGGVASTILDLVTAPPRVLRLGGLTLEALRMVLPELVLAEDARIAR
jgi:L-threonylcarbamoyladenylate synthase